MNLNLNVIGVIRKKSNQKKKVKNEYINFKGRYDSPFREIF
jgi:hypothetical protein